MALFKKRETLTQNIAYMGIMAAINVIFVVLCTYVLPVLFFILIFILPLTSVVVALFCKKRYFPIYAIATVAICAVTTLFDISNTLFYVVPSIISGFIFSVLIERKAPTVWIVFSGSVISLLFSYFSVPVIASIYGRNIISDIATIFGLGSYQYIDYVAPVFFYIIALASSTVSYFIIKEELPKLGYTVNDNNATLLTYISGLVVATICLILAFTYKPLSYLFMCFTIFFSIFALVEMFAHLKKHIFVEIIMCLIVTIIMFVILYQKVVPPLGLLLINIFFVLSIIIALINNCLLKQSKDVK